MAIPMLIKTEHEGYPLFLTAAHLVLLALLLILILLFAVRLLSVSCPNYQLILMLGKMLNFIVYSLAQSVKNKQADKIHPYY